MDAETSHVTQAGGEGAAQTTDTNGNGRAKRRLGWNILGRRHNANAETSTPASLSDQEADKAPAKWNMGMLNDRQTEEVPGSILLLSKASEFNEPLGLRNAPARVSASSLPSPYLDRRSLSRQRSVGQEKKRTADGKIVLEPQPDDSLNDPLNWKIWRRDAALLSLGIYCLLGGGMTTILAAGFNDIAAQFNTSEASVALTTGLYMMGLGLGSVFLSPTAILFGKRPVYLAAAICFIITSAWCALSPNLTSLILGRIFMGFAVSSVECLPSASVAEIFFLHEKAYRLGIYTLLLLGGKNLVPLVSAVIIQDLGWRWVFWIVCMIVAFAWCLLFLFVPETFWDRTPRPHRYLQQPHTRSSRSRSIFRMPSFMLPSGADNADHVPEQQIDEDDIERTPSSPDTSRRRARFAGVDEGSDVEKSDEKPALDDAPRLAENPKDHASTEDEKHEANVGDETSTAHDAHVPPMTDYFSGGDARAPAHAAPAPASSAVRSSTDDLEQQSNTLPDATPTLPYTESLQQQPLKSFRQSLKPWNGRLRKDKWLRVAMRPFILFAYPAILWSALVYALSVGWLIVLSESVSHIFEDAATYDFDALHTGLLYISPFVAGVMGTAVAGKVSDRVVRFMARRNGGVYEPEFRLVMILPVALSTSIGLMGYGWSAEVLDPWIAPTLFFGCVSFGCTLGSTTAITFAVDSYRQYAGEALVTLNFSKNIFHGMVFSLFFNTWLDADGSKTTFVAIGCIQVACLLTTIPMYIYGKRARMWTVRKNLMERF